MTIFQFRFSPYSKSSKLYRHQTNEWQIANQHQYKNKKHFSMLWIAWQINYRNCGQWCFAMVPRNQLVMKIIPGSFQHSHRREKHHSKAIQSWTAPLCDWPEWRSSQMSLEHSAKKGKLLKDTARHKKHLVTKFSTKTMNRVCYSHDTCLV